MSERDKLIDNMLTKVEMNPEFLVALEKSKKTNNPLANEILELLASRNTMDLNALKVKYTKLQKKVQKYVVDPNVCTDSEDNFSFIHGMATLAEAAEELEESQLYLETLIKSIGNSSDECRKIFLLEFTIELGSLLLKMRKMKAAKKNLKLTNEMYQYMTSLDENVKKVYQHYCEGNGKSTFQFRIQLCHLMLLRNYENYYRQLQDSEKEVHNGILVLKYELKYNLCNKISWIQHAINLSSSCCENRAYCQSHYLLRAADALHQTLKPTTVTTDSSEKITAQSIFLEGRIKLGFAQHCLFLLYQTKNVSFIWQKLKEGAQLTDDEKFDAKSIEKITRFDELTTVSVGDKKLDRLLGDFDEIREVYKNVKDLMADAAKKLTINEKKEYDYDFVADKLKELLNAYPFLVDIK